MQFLDTVKSLFSCPLKALFSVSFYFEVLFKMRGIGFLYLLFLSLIVALPVSYRANDVIVSLKDANFPAMVQQIPACYLNQNGVLSVADGDCAYKEIISADRNVSIVFNVEDRPFQALNTPMSVELYSDSFVLSVLGQRISQKYKDSFEGGSNFNPVIQSQVAEMVLDIAVYFTCLIVACLLFFKLLFLSLLSALISKFIFVSVGKMKTGFSNVWRLNIYASTSIALAMIIQALMRIQLSDFILLLMPVAYMLAFIKVFRRELEKGSIEDFVLKYAPEGTKVRKSEGSEVRDLSEYTQGLDSTSNQQNARNEDNTQKEDASSDRENGIERTTDRKNGSSDHTGSFSA